MEMLQMLKFHIKKERFNFSTGWITSEAQMVDDDPDVDVLGMLVNGDSQEMLDKAIRSVFDGGI